MTISTVKIAVFHVETVKTMKSVIILMGPALMDVIRGIKAPNVLKVFRTTFVVLSQINSLHYIKVN